jgi:hypothetical protein
MGGPDERVRVMRAEQVAAEKPAIADFNTLAIACRGSTRCGAAVVRSGIAGCGFRA